MINISLKNWITNLTHNFSGLFLGGGILVSVGFFIVVGIEYLIKGKVVFESQGDYSVGFGFALIWFAFSISLIVHTIIFIIISFNRQKYKFWILGLSSALFFAIAISIQFLSGSFQLGKIGAKLIPFIPIVSSIIINFLFFIKKSKESK